MTTTPPTRDAILDDALELVRAAHDGDPEAAASLIGTTAIEDVPALLLRLSALAVAALRAGDLDTLAHHVEYLQDLHAQGQEGS